MTNGMIFWFLEYSEVSVCDVPPPITVGLRYATWGALAFADCKPA